VVDLLFPPVCRFCRLPLPEGMGDFCAACRAGLTEDASSTCLRCGSSLGPHAASEGGCSRCRKDRYRFDGVIRLGRYRDVLREAVLRSKRAADELLAHGLGLLLGERVRQVLGPVPADAVVPVPLHWLRRWRRGYNQAQALAEGVASTLGIPCLSGALRRIRHTPAQTRQTPQERRKNLRGAFRIAAWRRLRGRTILLIDDVLTTGATAHEAARALKVAGAQQVVVAVAARSEDA